MFEFDLNLNDDKNISISAMQCTTIHRIILNASHGVAIRKYPPFIDYTIPKSFDQSIWLNGSIYHIEFIVYAHISSS